MKDDAKIQMTDYDCGRVAKGFKDHLERIRDAMIDHYHRVAKYFAVQKILVTGHSLGGLFEFE